MRDGTNIPVERVVLKCQAFSILHEHVRLWPRCSLHNRKFQCRSTVAHYHMGDKTLLGSLNHVKILSNFVDPCKTTVLHTIRKVSLHFDGISTREYVVIIPSDASQFFHSLTHTYTPASIPSPSPPRSSHGPSPSIPKVSSGLSIMRLCD
jgi:hypothetical protein